MDIVQDIRDFVENECRKETSHYGYDIFKYHIISTAAYAEKLAEKFGGDKEVIMLAAWLHDIGSIMHGRKDHHITGAAIAQEKLKLMGYPKDKIELVKKCILNHRGSQNLLRSTIEEQIVAEADVLSNFENIPGIFKAALVYENKDQAETKMSVRQKIRNKWNQLHFDRSRKMIKPKFRAAMILLA